MLWMLPSLSGKHVNQSLFLPWGSTVVCFTFAFSVRVPVFLWAKPVRVSWQEKAGLVSLRAEIKAPQRSRLYRNTFTFFQLTSVHLLNPHAVFLSSKTTFGLFGPYKAFFWIDFVFLFLHFSKNFTTCESFLFTKLSFSVFFSF